MTQATNGTKFNHIAKEGYLQTTSVYFVDLLTVDLSYAIEGEFCYVKGWVFGNDQSSGLYLKKFSQAFVGNNLLSAPGSEIANTINTFVHASPSAEITAHGRTIKLRVLADGVQIGFYGKLEVHGIKKDVNG